MRHTGNVTALLGVLTAVAGLAIPELGSVGALMLVGGLAMALAGRLLHDQRS